jgi:hypothetical protein
VIERALARAEAVGEARVAEVVAQLAERVRAEVPGVAAEAGDGRVEIAGRGLGRRVAGEAGLRWIGGMLR